jgi:orotidine-5'-phosphate decarboxylase
MGIVKNTGIILALDVVDRAKAIEIAKKTREYVDAIKVGYPLVLNTSIDVISEISKVQNVIADFKIADIPYVSRIIAETALEHRAMGVIVHGFVGRDVLLAIRNVTEASDAEMYVVTEMSHPGARDFIMEHTQAMAEMAVKVEADGVVAPATRPERIKLIREIVGDRKIICPGVGAQGGEIKKVLSYGGDFAIVGRRVYNSPDPAGEVRALIREIKGK